MEERGYLKGREGDESEDEIEDPRTLNDLEKENIDLKEEMIHQMMTLEQYLGVANMWLAEKSGLNTNDDVHSQMAQGSQTISLGTQPFVGVDYTEDQLDNNSILDYSFHPEDPDDGTRSVKSVQVRSAKSLSIPQKVSKLGLKVKEIFYSKYHANQILRIPSQRDKLIYNKEKVVQNVQANEHTSFQIRLAEEVEAMKSFLESALRNQRLTDLENRIRDNKRTIVNLISENIFILKNGSKETDKHQ